ncbi:MAG: TolC family protein [Verrucomicrobiota bacterium]|nr:TolC family protein [Verrucomicrobiota bacterium]
MIIHRHLIFLLSLVFISCPVNLTAQEKNNKESKKSPILQKVTPKALDLPSCYQISVQRSESLGIRFQEYKAAEARYWQAVSTIMPNLKFIAEERLQNNTFTSGSSTAGSPLNAGVAVGGGATSNNPRNNAFTGRFNVTQPIFHGFRDFSLIAAQKAQTKAVDLDYRRALQTFYYDVADVFYQIISYEQDLDLQYLLEKALQERVKELSQRVEIGRSRKSELLQAESQLADSAVLIEQTKGLVVAAKELMAFLTGIPAGQFSLIDRQPIPSVEKLEDYLWKSGTRPDIEAAVQRQTAATKDLSARKGEFLPTVNLEANYYAVQDPTTDREWNVVITGEVPLFDGGLRINRVKEGKAALKESQLSLSQVLRSSQTEVRTSYHNFISSVNQYIKLDKAFKIAKENYEVQKRDYELGRSSNLDVLVSLSNLYETRRRYLNTELQTKVNAISLQVAAGDIKE